MGGGGPKVSGGMTKAEYDAALAEQRQYEEKATAARDAKLAEYEQSRLSSEKELILAQKATEQSKIVSQQDAEAQIAEELKAQNQQSTTSASDKLGSSFYDSLYSGLYGSTSSSQTRPK